MEVLNTSIAGLMVLVSSSHSSRNCGPGVHSLSLKLSGRCMRGVTNGDSTHDVAREAAAAALEDLE